jgi:hypothetical protein
LKLYELYNIEIYSKRFGKRVGTLSLFVENENGIVSPNLWILSSSQGAEWRLARVNIGNALGSLSDWKIRFEALPDITDSPALSDDIAIDDISFDNCNPDDYLKPLRCDFEKDLCGWVNDFRSSQFNWTRNKGRILW